MTNIKKNTYIKSIYDNLKRTGKYEGEILNSLTLALYAFFKKYGDENRDRIIDSILKYNITIDCNNHKTHTEQIIDFINSKLIKNKGILNEIYINLQKEDLIQSIRDIGNTDLFELNYTIKHIKVHKKNDLLTNLFRPLYAKPDIKEKMDRDYLNNKEKEAIQSSIGKKEYRKLNSNIKDIEKLIKKVNNGHTKSAYPLSEKYSKVKTSIINKYTNQNFRQEPVIK